MNATADYIKFYASRVYSFDGEGRLPFADVLTYVRFDLTADERRAYERATVKSSTGGYRRLFTEFKSIVVEEYGEEVLTVDSRNRTVFRLRSRYVEAECAVVPPWKGPEVEGYETVRKQALGFSKLAFRRWGYYHTGICMRRRDGHLDLFELTKTDGDKYKIVVRDAQEALEGENAVFFDNSCLGDSKGLDAKKILHRMARLVNTVPEYNLTRMQCDVVATYLLTGVPRWSTVKCHSCIPEKFRCLPNVFANMLANMFTQPGDITVETLRKIEEELD